MWNHHFGLLNNQGNSWGNQPQLLSGTGTTQAQTGAVTPPEPVPPWSHQRFQLLKTSYGKWQTCYQRKYPKISPEYLRTTNQWKQPLLYKSARTEGAEAFFVCLREPLAIAL